jgi:alpha-tubulin suppressor-like RCC1 family protein
MHKSSLVSAGARHSLVVNSRGQIFSFGCGQSGQLGLGNYRNESRPMIIKPIEDVFESIIAISAGNDCSLLVNSDHLLLIIGNGGLYCPHYDDDPADNFPHLMDIFNGVDIMAISSSLYGSSLVFDAKGQVFGFGYNGNGVLGLGKLDEITTDELYLTKSENLGMITAISTGAEHSLLLNSRGQVFSTGTNHVGEAGLGLMVAFVTIPTLIKDIQANIVAISAGFNHSLLLDNQGRVYSFGSNDHGQLGIEKVRIRCIPTLIETFHDGDGLIIERPQIVAISAGNCYSLLLDSQGRVFSFGSDHHGKLGLGSKGNKGIPTLITTFEMKGEDSAPMSAISAGKDHSLIADSRGRVFSFGNNEHGQLGLGDNLNRSIPILIKDLLI